MIMLNISTHSPSSFTIISSQVVLLCFCFLLGYCVLCSKSSDPCSVSIANHLSHSNTLALLFQANELFLILSVQSCPCSLFHTPLPPALQYNDQRVAGKKSHLPHLEPVL